MKPKYTISQVAELVESFYAMRAMGSSFQDGLTDCAAALRSGKVDCFICSGTGKSDWHGYWKYDFNKKENVWIEKDNTNNICPHCNGTGFNIITIEELERLKLT